MLVPITLLPPHSQRMSSAAPLGPGRFGSTIRGLAVARSEGTNLPRRIVVAGSIHGPPPVRRSHVATAMPRSGGHPPDHADPGPTSSPRGLQNPPSFVGALRPG